MQIISFMALVFSVYAAVNVWLFARLWLTLKGAGPARGISCAALFLCSLSFPLSRAVYSSLPEPLGSLFIRAGDCWIPFMIYGFIFALAADILRLINLKLSLTRLPPPFSLGERVAVVRAVVLLAIAVSVAGMINARFVTTVYRSAELAPRGEGRTLRAAIVSDVHLGRSVGLEHLRKIAAQVSGTGPDIVILAGDTIDDTEAPLGPRGEEWRAEAKEIFTSMTPRFGIWAVNGNHEFYAGADICDRILEGCGVRVLRDEWAMPGGELLLIGREDRGADRFGAPRRELRSIMDEAASKLDADLQDVPIIIADHQPIDIAEAEGAGADLMISGHTHRGQLAPINFLVAAMYECHYGLMRRGNMTLCVTSGAGTWGPPARTTGRPEIVALDISY